MLKNRCYAVAVAKRGNNKSINPSDYRYNVIPNGHNYWVADPFPIEVDGKLYIFGEIYEYARLKGAIAYTKQTKNGFTPWKKIIEEPYHLSFPNIFYLGKNLYMCPESHANRSLQLYKCVEFPEKWTICNKIMNNEDCVDTVFLEKENEIIGFTCEWHSLKDHFFRMFRIDKKTNSYIFSNEEFDTVEDYMSRPAGKIIESIDGPVMVSQICRPLYGSGLVFKKINEEFPYFSEVEQFRVFPNQIKSNLKRNFDGMHTFNMTNNYVVIDLIWTRFNVIEKFYRLCKKIIEPFHKNHCINPGIV